MNRASLYKSIGLHLTAFLLLVVDLPSFHRHKLVVGQAPIIVDLSEVKISEMTNLPPKAEIGEKNQKATAEKKKEVYTHEEEDESQPQEAVEDKTSNNSFLEAPKPTEKPKAPQDKKPKPIPPKPSRKPKPPAMPQEKKPEPKTENKPQPKPEEKSAQAVNPLKSLMDSVDELKAQVGETTQKATITADEKVAQMGIEGGIEGSYFGELTISETDVIASRLRQCWNLDPGAMGLKDMIIEIRAFLNPDGTVRDVKILDTSRYNSDNRFRAIADSAKRAVISCQNHNNVNIYQIFAEKYADKYDMWKTLMLRFNPLDGGVN